VFRYPWQLPVRLAACVEHHQVAEAHRDLDRLLAIIAGERSGGLMLRKLRCAQAITLCTRGALQGGAPSSALYEDSLRILRQVARQRTWKALAALMHGYVDELLAQVQPQRRTNVERFVAWMRQDMTATLEAPKSLAQYAEAAGLSARHLSRCFAATAGRTFREELRHLRTEAACRLLREKGLKVSTVARMVGLKDASQFIADFRRETGQTPAAYREAQRQ
jgi:AraC-like DNA-binding protein